MKNSEVWVFGPTPKKNPDDDLDLQCGYFSSEPCSTVVKYVVWYNVSWKWYASYTHSLTVCTRVELWRPLTKEGVNKLQIPGVKSRKSPIASQPNKQSTVAVAAQLEKTALFLWSTNFLDCFFFLYQEVACHLQACPIITQATLYLIFCGVCTSTAQHTFFHFIRSENPLWNSSKATGW